MATTLRHDLSTSRGLATPVRAVLALVALLSWTTAPTQGGLYGPEAPLDAAWVRVVNVAAAGGMAVRVADAPTVVLPLGGATRYVLVTPGEVDIDVGGTHLGIDVSPESFTTVAATPEGTLVIDDPALRDASRGLLGLLNLTDRTALTLRVPDGTVVVGDVPGGGHDALPVAQATTALLVTDGDEVLVRLEPHAFLRGVAYVVIVFEGPEGLRAELLSTGVD
jgi:hypothetical protein